MAAYTAFLPAADGPDETLLRGQIMSSLADQVGTSIHDRPNASTTNGSIDRLTHPDRPTPYVRSPRQVSYFLGTYGPSITMETACSSSLVAIAMAVASLQQGDCDTALVTGLNYLNEKDFHLSLQVRHDPPRPPIGPRPMVFESKAQPLFRPLPHPPPQQACGVMVQGPTSHPFDEDGPKGYIRGEGMGTIVLRRLSDAEARGDRILCKILRAIAASAGPADNALEGPGRIYEQPCPYGMREMFSRVYKCAGVPLAKLHYMECHGACVLSCVSVMSVLIFLCLPASRPIPSA